MESSSEMDNNTLQISESIQKSRHALKAALQIIEPLFWQSVLCLSGLSSIGYFLNLSHESGYAA